MQIVRLTTGDVSGALSSAKSYTDTQFQTLDGEISAKVSQTDYNALGNRVSANETHITANSNSITQQATSINDLSGRMSTAEAKITSDAINLTVKSQIDNAQTAAKSYTDSQIKVTNDAISSKVSQTDYNGNTVASLINQTSTTINIEASHINLSGAVTISAIDKSSVTASALGGATPYDVNIRCKI